MNNKYFIEDKNIRVSEDTIVGDTHVEAGTKITLLSRQGEYSGYKMRVPPPEFEALLLFHALDSAAKAETLKKMVVTENAPYDGMLQIELSDNNISNFHNMCQYGMAAAAFAVSAIESWVNNSLVIHGVKKGKPMELTLKRPSKPDKIVLSDSIASDLSIPLRPKLFQLIPQVYSCQPLKEHSTLRKRIGHIIDERNIVMHMQNSLSLSNQVSERLNYSVKLFKTNSFSAPETIIKYIQYVYDNSPIEEASWVSEAEKELKLIKSKLK